jgi:CBS domain-containing protein
MQARDVMVCGVILVGPDIPVRIAANAMVSNCVSALPVVDIYAKLVGIVSEGDLIRRVEIGSERRRRPFNIIVNDRCADLWGFVYSADEKTAVRVAAEATPGIESVSDHLGIASQTSWT